MVCRTMRPVLDSLGIENHTITRHDELEFIVAGPPEDMMT